MTVDQVRSTGTGSQRGRTILAEVHFVEPGLARTERVGERESIREEQELTLDWDGSTVVGTPAPWDTCGLLPFRVVRCVASRSTRTGVKASPGTSR